MAELADISYGLRYTYIFAATLRATSENSKPTLINRQSDARKGCFDRPFASLPELVVSYSLGYTIRKIVRVYL